MHPELPDDLVYRIEKACILKIPFSQYPALIELSYSGFFYSQWIDFVFHSAPRPTLLIAYWAYGAAAGWYFDPKYVEKKVKIIEAWAPQAQKDFIAKRLAPFQRCSVYGRKERKKHWPPPNKSKQKLLELSKRSKESLFFPNIKRIDLQQGLWLVMAQFFDRFRRKNIRFAVVDFEMPIGTSKGRLCTHVKYDIAKDGRHAHAYPIEKSEQKRHPSVSLSSFNLRLKKSSS